MGDTGPGGGIVFYDAGSPQSWGRYLEAAPNTWAGGSEDPEIVWCNTVGFLPVPATGDTTTAHTHTAIGWGWSNTVLMAAHCAHGAANAVRGYHGGGKSDWFLPSKDELNEMYIQKSVVGGFGDNYYWSSSEYDSNSAWYQYFYNGSQFIGYKGIRLSVRPARAF